MNFGEVIAGVVLGFSDEGPEHKFKDFIDFEEVDDEGD